MKVNHKSVSPESLFILYSGYLLYNKSHKTQWLKTANNDCNSWFCGSVFGEQFFCSMWHDWGHLVVFRLTPSHGGLERWFGLDPFTSQCRSISQEVEAASLPKGWLRNWHIITSAIVFWLRQNFLRFDRKSIKEFVESLICHPGRHTKTHTYTQICLLCHRHLQRETKLFIIYISTEIGFKI